MKPIIVKDRICLIDPGTPVMVFWDWDGTIVNTMPAHATLAAECINRYFGIKIPEARKRYLDTTGIPFDRQLEIISPDASSSLREECAREYHEKKMVDVYGDPKNFPETLKVLEKLSELNLFQVISSSTEESIIESWARRNGCKLPILGREHGSKKDHIAKLKKEFNSAFCIFVSDSFGDMDLPVDMTLGVDVPGSRFDQFVRRGAAIISEKPISLEWADCWLKEIGLV